VIVSVAVQERENCRDGIYFPGIFLELFGFFLERSPLVKVATIAEGLCGAVSASFGRRQMLKM
jgi:hypothetical protein